MSSTQHQLIEQCATRLRGIVEALDNIHHTSPQRWLTDLDDVHSSAESLLAMIKDQAPPSEDQLIAAGLSYPLAKEDAVKLWYSGFRSEVITVLEAWEAIGHDTGINPDKEELLESLRNMAAICNAHGNDMPAQSAIDQRQVIADAITGALAFGAQASQPPAEDHWLRPFYDIGRAEGQRTQELAMLVRMLAASLKRHAPESNLVARATNYLAAKGLAGTPLRDPPAPVEQAGRDVEPAPCPFCGGEVDPTGWLRGDGTRGPECNDCGATARSMEAWQTRTAMTQPEGSPVIGCLCGMPMTEGHHSPAGCSSLEEFATHSDQAQHSVPEGYALIPTRETEAMHDAVMALLYKGVARTDTQKLLDAYIAAAPGKEVPQAWHDVQAERRRQIEAEGWTPEHDDAHSHGQMARAAACYALAGSSAPNDGTAALLVSLAWPWDEQWWKPSTARRDMVKACALALAEIERLDRAAASQGGPSDA
ncbi:hypothetical protein [Pseudomonas aeruginosa]|uniref:Uncharacterized protein n=1 Tax=Pseudomonas phage LKA5 TaxID=1327940 RepID=A0A0U1UNM2_9CAUD|nr:hypothetical protein [Pseudomonas aeruginosa]YP_010765892.1 hypothetical protein QGM58_gp04 [Pseudomonas phage LKA5]AGR46356.1 hypothetical protein LKA5_01.2 [Pseudomonas phage LKA5]KSR58897.1 hypothetical protein APB46_20005 [Pseudomonas aeruginosa]